MPASGAQVGPAPGGRPVPGACSASAVHWRSSSGRDRGNSHAPSLVVLLREVAVPPLRPAHWPNAFSAPRPTAVGSPVPAIRGQSSSLKPVDSPGAFLPRDQKLPTSSRLMASRDKNQLPPWGVEEVRGARRRAPHTLVESPGPPLSGGVGVQGVSPNRAAVWTTSGRPMGTLLETASRRHRPARSTPGRGAVGGGGQRTRPWRCSEGLRREPAKRSGTHRSRRATISAAMWSRSTACRYPFNAGPAASVVRPDAFSASGGLSGCAAPHGEKGCRTSAGYRRCSWQERYPDLGSTSAGHIGPPDARRAEPAIDLAAAVDVRTALIGCLPCG